MQKPENWKDLTWQEKREWRFKRWRAAEGVKFESAEAKKKHDARVDRIIKAIKLEELPDRVPIDIAAGSFPAYYAGYDLKTVMYDAEKMRESFMKFARDFQTDTMPMAMVSSARVLEYTQSYTMKWPGGGCRTTPLSSSSSKKSICRRTSTTSISGTRRTTFSVNSFPARRGSSRLFPNSGRSIPSWGSVNN